MLKPETIAVQEIKVVPSKSKIMDMVAIRHNTGGEQRTTLILLCEDGSLKIYMANMEQTGNLHDFIIYSVVSFIQLLLGFWMSPSIQPTMANAPVKQKKKKLTKTGKNTSTICLPVDYFEHCQPMEEVDYGGNDLLQVYNVAQLKHRLNTTGAYIVCTKPLGFSLEVTNNDSNMVITGNNNYFGLLQFSVISFYLGIRVLVGSQDPQRAPSFVDIFGRIITFFVTRSRWYDIPFSREESLQCDKKLTMMFGPSQDPETVTMVDSVKM